MREEMIFSTSKREELIDITSEVNKIIVKSKTISGLCSVFSRHTTAAIIINENYDTKICDDLLDCLSKLIPKGIWRHDRIDGNANSHIKSAILGASQTIPIKDGKMDFGPWQSLMFAELDGPREDRSIVVTIIPDK